HPPPPAGARPFRMRELGQRRRIGVRLWRNEPDRLKRQWIEQRIINDAGILGHYVTDAANPHHSTIHYNGWSGPNPKGYTTYSRDRGFHYRFEEEFVGAQIVINDLYPLMGVEAQVVRNPRDEIWAFVQKSNDLVEQLYILDKQEPFAATTKSATHKRFAAERLAAGASLLRDLWWTAWVTSAEAPPPTSR
ncbi:MAG: nuclease, partial [Acidobacteriota bacterium]